MKIGESLFEIRDVGMLTYLNVDSRPFEIEKLLFENREQLFEAGDR